MIFSFWSLINSQVLREGYHSNHLPSCKQPDNMSMSLMQVWKLLRGHGHLREGSKDTIPPFSFPGWHPPALPSSLLLSSLTFSHSSLLSVSFHLSLFKSELQLLSFFNLFIILFLERVILQFKRQRIGKSTGNCLRNVYVTVGLLCVWAFVWMLYIY